VLDWILLALPLVVAASFAVTAVLLLLLLPRALSL
jgi:hypothetical protein